MKKKALFSGAAILTLAAATTAILMLWPKPPIPKAIQDQVTAPIFVPKSDNIVILRETVEYNDKLKMLAMTWRAFDTKVVISEQPTPENFIDIPQVFTKVLENMQEYEKFDSAVGTVHLTKPKELGGKQAAVLNSKGTLLFAKPDNNLSSDQWRRFFKDIEVLE